MARTKQDRDYENQQGREQTNRLKQELENLDILYAEYQHYKWNFPNDKMAAISKKKFFDEKGRIESGYGRSLRELRIFLMDKDSQKFMEKFVHVS